MLLSPSTSIVTSSVKGNASISASNEVSLAKRVDSSASNSLTTSANESIEFKSVLAMIEETSLDNTVAIESSASVALEISAANATSNEPSAAILAASSLAIDSFKSLDSSSIFSFNEASADTLELTSDSIAVSC